MPLLQDISNWLGQLTETNRMRLGMDSESGSAVEIQQRLDSATEKAWALDKRVDAMCGRMDGADNEYEAAVRAASQNLKAFPKGPMGLTPEDVKNSPEYKAAKQAYSSAFERLRQFNSSKK